MSRGKKIALGIAAVVVLLAGTGLVLYYVTGWGAYDLPVAARDLPEAKRAAEAAGIWSQPPTATGIPQEDFRKISRANRMMKPESKELNTAGFSAATLASKRAALAADRRKALTLAAIPAVAWKTTAFAMPTDFDAATRVLALAARMGRVDDALEDVRAGKKLGRLLGQGTPLIFAEVAAAGEVNTMLGAVQCINAWRKNPGALKRLQSVLAEADWSVDSVFIAKSEEYSLRQLLSASPTKGQVALRSLGGSENPFGVPDIKVPAGMARDAVLARHYRFFTRLIKAAKKGWAEMGRVAEEEKRLVKAHPAISRVYQRDVLDYGAMEGFFSEVEARRRVVRAAIAHLLDRNAPLPEDPCSPGEKLLLVNRLGGGFVLYSRGRDGLDDNGAVAPKRGDMGFEFGG
jgi:hypothetical protein